MKQSTTILGFSLFFTLMFLTGCDQSKSEDKKIKEALIGKYYQEDEFDENGTKTKDIRGEFFENGKFISQATLEILDDETFETTDLEMQIAGEWKVKDNFIYYTYDFDEFNIKPDYYMLMKDAMIKAIKDNNTPDKVIEYDASKVVYETSDGERKVMKKVY